MMFLDFVEKYEGIITTESQEEISELGQLITQVHADYAQALEDCAAGIITEDELFTYYMIYESYETECVFYENISEYTEYLFHLKESEGIDGWYLNLYSYNYLLKYRNTFADIVLLLSVVLLCSNIFAYDKRNGMKYVLRSCAYGRSRLFKNQILMAAGVSFTLSLIAVGFEISSTLYIYSLSGLSAPIQSIPALGFVPFSCSVSIFLLLVYLTKILILVFCGIIVSAFSVSLNQKICTSVAIILCIPDLLSIAGLRIFENLSVLKVLSTGAFMLECKSIWNMLIVLFTLAAVAFIGTIAAYRDWCCLNKR